jgi:hypothetical protein
MKSLLNSPSSLLQRCKMTALFHALLLGFTSMASAHPGHYHPPDETDEFDMLRANFLHLHGMLEISAACIALAAVVVYKMNRKKHVRIATAIVFGSALTFLALH